MENAILGKLGLKLAESPQNEADVVYILVEIRKYLDHTDPKGGQYAVLRTYCDWPVHILLSQNGAEILLRSLDDAFAAPETERGRAIRAAFDKFSLTEFLNELRRFLRSKGLPCTLVEDRVWWGEFLKHYVAVVSDCPFVYKGKPRHAKEIKKAALEINETTKSLERVTEGAVNIVWAWELEFADGTTSRISNTYGYQLE
jgi:hypothetical protein